MRTLRSTSLILALGALVSTAALLGQSPASPPDKAEVQLAEKTITIHYSRPYRHGRKIMGGLVPYGQVWRTGADDATSFKTPIDLEIGGVLVPAGNYTIYTLPAEGTWKLIINKQTGQWGLEYNQAQDLARIDLRKSPLASPIEQFTIEFVKKSADAADLLLEWETTKLSVPVRAKRR